MAKKKVKAEAEQVEESGEAVVPEHEAEPVESKGGEYESHPKFSKFRKVTEK